MYSVVTSADVCEWPISLNKTMIKFWSTESRDLSQAVHTWLTFKGRCPPISRHHVTPRVKSAFVVMVIQLSFHFPLRQ